ncbi:MAG: endospore germination permease [Desulfotomaculaceae bacterium]|nr:endospore germination permease [Desulfotomaculaceae bacterium]
MIKEGKFGLAEAIILMAVSNVARVFLPYPRYLVELGGSAAWMTPIGGLAVTLVGAYIMSLVLKKNPDNTIIEITEEAFGSILGITFNLITIAFFISVCFLFVREFSEALITAALPETPISVIATVYIAIGLLGSYLGIEAIARSTRLTYIYVFGGIVLLLFALTPQWKFDNLFPVFGNGFFPIFGLGAFSTAAVTEIILAAVLVQAIGGADKYMRINFFAALIAFTVLGVLLAALVLTMGKEVATETSLPFYRLSRNIYLGRFFQRVEALFIIIWSIVGAIKIALTLYGASVSLARTLKLPDYRPLIWPLGLIVFIFSFLPPDLPTTMKLDTDFLRPFAHIPNYLLPLLILAAYWLKGRMRRAGS